MAGDDLLASLEAVSERFNFGEYEAKAYLTILEHGQVTASEIADYTDIPQPRVYDTVRSLSDIGLVELQESRPMKVLALDPAEAFDDLQESLDTLVDGLEQQYTQPARGTEAVSLVKSRPTILRYLSEVIDSADYELMLSLTPELLERFESQLRRQYEDGVAIELLISPAAEVEAPAEYDYDDLASTVKQRRGVTTPVVAVADGRYSIYATRESLKGDTDRYGVIFDRSELGFLVSMFMNTVLWTTAETVRTDGEELTFPRRYGTIRRAISDMVDLDGEFYATIEGRDVLTGEELVVEGKVVDTSITSSLEEASLVVETDEGRVTVGGQVAALEDIESFEIRIGRDSPPEPAD
ncbi:TrmB family transcriptional regulator [Halosimplex rubrum]|uniref:TrmB family transcriptional regulator n=1 Tax=Halosimplex rubrum TaxID=869889 RepID=A0A7D5P1P2_9EURY|nr:TrmB family transcriptional regulator [Halosimplex rubrum]QLH78626.1 TrmB family transcriptional regulator [Halosimplex rubrum]